MADSPKMVPKNVYTVYVGVKQVAVAALLIVLAFGLSKQINGYYSRSACASCSDLASQYPKIGFEFSVCASQYTPNIKKNNLMTSNVLSPVASPVPLMVPVAFLLLVVALGYGGWAYWRWGGKDSFNPRDAFLFNTAITTLWLVVGNGFFQLFLRSGCYLSAWNTDYMFIQWWLNALVLVPLAGYALAINVCKSCDTKHIVEYIFLGLSVLGVLAMVIFSMYLAQMNVKHTRAAAHWVFVAIMALSLIDGAVFWYTQREPTKAAGDAAAADDPAKPIATGPKSDAGEQKDKGKKAGKP